MIPLSCSKQFFDNTESNHKATNVNPSAKIKRAGPIRTRPYDIDIELMAVAKAGWPRRQSGCTRDKSIWMYFHI